jgi:hypothetical protein
MVYMPGTYWILCGNIQAYLFEESVHEEEKEEEEEEEEGEGEEEEEKVKEGENKGEH